jgi:hypothetical protein
LLFVTRTISKMELRQVHQHLQTMEHIKYMLGMDQVVYLGNKINKKYNNTMSFSNIFNDTLLFGRV